MSHSKEKREHKTVTVNRDSVPLDSQPTAPLKDSPRVTTPPAFCSGDIVAERFRIVRFVSQGGMGEVYEAEDQELGERVALKTIRQAFAEDDAALDRFRREVLLARRVTHPNVCRIFDVFHHRDQQVPESDSPTEVVFLTMELLSGETLAERLSRAGRLTPREALPIVEQMAAALEAAHCAGIVHRDFKSSNVMLMETREGLLRAVVTDFGLAGAVSEEAQDEDLRGSAMGTPAYMAPEQVKGEEVTPAADIYSLGVVLFEMVTGTFPFAGRTPSATATMRLQRDPPSPRRHVADLDERWERAILRCLARRPADRFDSPGQVARALGSTSFTRVLEAAPRRTRGSWWAGVLGLAVLFALVLVFRQGREVGPPTLRSRQITTSAGLDLYPALSPDGGWLAYTSDRSGSFEIYVRDMGSGSAERRLTEDAGENFQPAWSPDGRQIVYHSTAHGGLWIVPSKGGMPRRLTTFGSRPAWSSSGKWIAFQSEGLVDLAANAMPAMPPAVLLVVGAEGGEPRAVTSPGVPPGGHGGPHWSPDERRLVFTAADRRTSAVWSVGLNGADPVRLSSSGVRSYDPVYAPDGARVYFASVSAKGGYGMWERPVNRDGRPTGASVRLADLGLGTSRHLSVARDGTKIVFSAVRISSNLWRLPLQDGRPAAPVPLSSETGRNTRPVFAPDGSRVAYDRWTTGSNPDIWVMDAEGGQPVQYTNDPGVDSLPNWDGESVVFLSNRSGQTAVWSRAPGDKTARKLFTPEGNVDWVRLAPDGRAFVFNHRGQDGIINVWRADLNSGVERPLTSDREFAGFACWSPDGRRLAVQLKRGAHSQIAVMPGNGGELRQLTNHAGQSWPYSWSPDGRYVAFAGFRDGFWNIYRVSAETSKEERLTNYAKLNAYVRYPAWSPRGGVLIYEYAETTGNIWVLEGLRSPGW